ncbi:hypothetical protein [Heyndrickxia acidicola]|uniref:Uncharacterized protein n=2 Tax=Heyndrickxia acidicola TaxID=209389 RepID=A0ABU6MJ51_9BACI|nr:hypothetical protein [Heyndrickxia acidicola]MED1203683.1 hypothetical protein [Heyndrickxia acidicola]
MKNSKLLLLAMVILPWLTLPFLGKNTFKKYLPSAIFIVTFTKALDFFGEKKKWWRFYKGIPPLDSMDFFNFGPYFVTSLWMLKLTYGKFPLYFISNTILHILFTFVGLKYLKRYKIASIVKMTKLQHLTMSIIRGLVFYGFQSINERKRALFK